MERCLAVDSLALLGGNEYLVQQIMDSGNEHAFSKEGESALQFAISSLWHCPPMPGCPQRKVDPYTSLAPLLELLSPLHRDRLPRILATALLYCGRYPDTAVVALPASHPTTRLLLLTPGRALPLGQPWQGAQGEEGLQRPPEK